MDMTLPRLVLDNADRPDSESSHGLNAITANEMEIELKLTTTPKSLTKLLALLSKSSAAVRSSRKTARIVSTYFDTEDRRLRKRGLTLRVRQKKGKLVQTIKSEADSASSVFARQEWTTPLAQKTPDLTAIDSGALRSRMGLILPQELSPLFKTDVKRTTLIVEHTTTPGDSAKVELAFDQGCIIAGKKTANICEVELELLEGSTTALIDLARQISAQIPAILSLSSKVSRGFELSDGSHPKAATASKIELPKGLSVEEAMVSILRPSLGQLLANRAAAMAGKDIEGVHQARVAIRRILSALSLFRNYLPDSQTAPLKQECRWLIDVLGGARDLDVFITEVLPAVAEDRPDDPDLSAILLTAKKTRTAAYRNVRSALSSRRYTDAMLTMSAWIEERTWRESVPQSLLDEPLKQLSPKLLTKRHRKVLNLGKNFAELAAERRHDVRIALKKMRYAAEFFASLYPASKTRPYISAMRHLQNALGAANDVATAETLTGMLVKQAKRGTKNADELSMGAWKILGWHTHAATDADRDILSLWTTYAESRPFWLSA
jgi:triphosphatase